MPSSSLHRPGRLLDARLTVRACCAHSDSVESANGVCLLNEEGTSRQLDVPCGQYELCTDLDQVCACNAQGCDGSLNGIDAPFDLRVNGDQIEGTGYTGRVYFTRVANP